MVWLHGGGYAAGSGQELPSYDGINLAKKGDAVVVTLNHRLNVLGFLDLSAYGDKYAKSGNAGLLDLVAALQWVNKNIDPLVEMLGMLPFSVNPVEEARYLRYLPRHRREACSIKPLYKADLCFARWSKSILVALAVP